MIRCSKGSRSDKRSRGSKGSRESKGNKGSKVKGGSSGRRGSLDVQTIRVGTWCVIGMIISVESY